MTTWPLEADWEILLSYSQVIPEKISLNVTAWKAHPLDFSCSETFTVIFNCKPPAKHISISSPPGTCLFLWFTPWENKGLQATACSALAKALKMHHNHLRSLSPYLLAPSQPQDELDFTHLPHPATCSTRFLSSRSGPTVQPFLSLPCSLPMFQLWL